MSILTERIRTHFTGLSSRKIEVPEWGENGAPLVIYARRKNLERAGAIAAAYDKGAAEGMVEALIQLAGDEHGKPIFDRKDRLDLLRFAASDVSVRIANFLTDEPTIAEAEKN